MLSHPEALKQMQFSPQYLYFNNHTHGVQTYTHLMEIFNNLRVKFTLLMCYDTGRYNQSGSLVGHIHIFCLSVFRDV